MQLASSHPVPRMSRLQARTIRRPRQPWRTVAPWRAPVSARVTTALFLSPHYDDVALSCGGTVAQTADAGTHALIVTIFGGEAATALILNSTAMCEAPSAHSPKRSVTRSA